MERAAKERLIGAVVLVSAAWLLIPVFLDQRPDRDDALVTRDLALPGQQEVADGTPALRRETIDLSVSAQPQRVGESETPPIAALPAPEVTVVQEQAPPDATDDSTDEVADSAPADRQPDEIAEREPQETPTPVSEESPPEVVQASVPETPAPSAPAPSAASDGQLWAVQLGSFSDEGNAQRLAARYRAEGLLAFVSEVQSSGRTLHRVRIGPQASRAESEAVVARLKAEGQTAGVVAHP